jgi:hypothetical protein
MTTRTGESGEGTWWRPVITAHRSSNSAVSASRAAGMAGTPVTTVPSPDVATARSSTYFGSSAVTVIHPARMRSRRSHRMAQTRPDLRQLLGPW